MHDPPFLLSTRYNSSMLFSRTLRKVDLAFVRKIYVSPTMVTKVYLRDAIGWSSAVVSAEYQMLFSTFLSTISVEVT